MSKRRPGRGLFRTVERLGNHVAQQRQAACNEDREWYVDQGLDLPPDADPLHQSLQQPGKQSRFQKDYEESGNIDVAGLVEVGDDGRDRSQEKRLHRKDANTRNDPALSNRGDLQHQDQRRHQGDDSVTKLRVGGKGHTQPQNRNVEMSASAPRMKATISNSGTRNRRNFALLVSTRTMRHASRSNFAR